MRTGLFQGLENHVVHPAKYVVEDVHEAVKLIFELEHIERDIPLV